ncbi:MAG: uracil-DNA glycosylase [Acidimicrobiia bacterium]
MSTHAIERLNELRTEALACTSCRLSEGRTQVVFGDGDPEADVVFVGEAPGQHEDEQGVPFVGRSGQLLDQLLGEIGLERRDVYIANVVKCRPPSNRDPRPDEIESCKGYLSEQLRLIDPKVVVTLGNFSSKLLLKTETGITRLRGTAYEWWGRLLVPTFHPAAALRGSAQVLEDMRFDFGLIRDAIDGNLGGETDGSEVGESSQPDVDPEQLGLFGR